MPSERAFRVLREQSDRVSFRQIASIALACVGLGLGLSGAAERFMHGSPRTAGRDKQSAQAAAERAPALASAAVAWPSLVGKPLIQPQTSTERAATGLQHPLRFARERVTYLRCQHARKGAACTRERALENQVWRALHSLAACYDATLPGRAELQLGLQRDHAPEIAFFAPADGPSLNLRAVRGCVERPLRKLSNRLSDEPMFVSFRFGLR